MRGGRSVMSNDICNDPTAPLAISLAELEHVCLM
jgi:hypothetical protein